MKILELQKIDKLYFGIEDIARVLGISLASAKVSANRYAKKGVLIRVKRNMYLLAEKWRTLGQKQKFMLANYLQSPSYISLMTALDYYEITSQIQQNFIESIAIKRTKQVNIEKSTFSFSRINRNLFTDFEKQDDFFIALPEKALADAVYLKSFGKYNFDLASIDFEKFDKKILKKISNKFPEKTKKILDKYGNI